MMRPITLALAVLLTIGVAATAQADGWPNFQPLFGGSRPYVGGHPYHDGNLFIPPSSAYSAVGPRPPLRYGAPSYYYPASFLYMGPQVRYGYYPMSTYYGGAPFANPYYLSTYATQSMTPAATGTYPSATYPTYPSDYTPGAGTVIEGGYGAGQAILPGTVIGN